MKLFRDKPYTLKEEKYCELARMIDGFVNVDKNIQDGCVIYSPSEIKSTDFSVQSITSGRIVLNHKDNSVIFSGDLGLSDDLEDKLTKLILSVDK